MEDYYSYTNINSQRVISSSNSKNKNRVKRIFSMMSGPESAQNPNLKRMKKSSHASPSQYVTYRNNNPSETVCDVEMPYAYQQQENLKKSYMDRVKNELSKYNLDLIKKDHKNIFLYDDCCDR